MGMDRRGLLQLPPFLRDVELVIMSLILVLMAGYLGQRGWVLEAEWLGAGILRPSFHPKTEPRPRKKTPKRVPVTWHEILVVECRDSYFMFFWKIIPNSSTVVGGHPLKKTQNNETCFFSPWLGWKFWIRVKYIQFFGPQNLKYLKKKSLTIQVCTTLVSKQRLPWKSLWPWKS